LVYVPDVLSDEQELQRAAMMHELAGFGPVETALGAAGVSVDCPSRVLRL
jgi:hypothetical protein